MTDGHEDPYEDPQRARESHRGHREGRGEYGDGAGSKHRQGSRGDEAAQYEARDSRHRDSRTDRRSREEEDDRHDDGGKSRHAAREEEEGYDRGRGHRDKDGYEEGREYARREHRSSRQDRSHRNDDRGHDR